MQYRELFLQALLVVVASSGMALGHSAVDDLPELSVDDVSKVIGDPNWVLVDTRSSDAFNGWTLDNVNRGGHLPGAVDFPSSWLDSTRKEKNTLLKAALQAKGIEPQRNIVLYAAKSFDRERVAAYLGERGFKHLYLFDFNKWARDPEAKLVRFEKFHLIVPPVIVKKLQDGDRPETFESAKRIKFVEASWGNEAGSYSKGHVPGSFHVNTDHFEPPPKWYLGDATVLAGFAKRYGFQSDDTVIVSGLKPMASFRLAVVLRYMGVADVRVLNGGLAAWRTAGYPVETKSTPPPKSDSFGTQIPGQPHLIDTIDRVRKGLQEPKQFTLVDTRTWAEFTGETSGYKYHLRKGRIPGPIYGQDAHRGPDSLAAYRNIDNTMRNPNEVREFWKASGIDTDTHLSFMCGGGWRAAEVMTFAEVMGLQKCSLYSDGWIGWSNDLKNPIVTGK
ncbi:MAG: rhodanese-like domain-containing protein [Planctomycetaceae bacterium]